MFLNPKVKRTSVLVCILLLPKFRKQVQEGDQHHGIMVSQRV